MGSTRQGAASCARLSLDRETARDLPGVAVVQRVSNDACHEDIMHSITPRHGRRTGPKALSPLSLAMSLACAALVLPAQAQQARLTDPSDPQVKVPAISYVGSLARYRALQDPPAASWQEVNEKANRAGGWRAYAREKLAPDESPAAPAAAPAPAAKPAPASKGHEGHAPR